MEKDLLTRWRPHIESIPILGPLLGLLIQLFTALLITNYINTPQNPPKLFPQMGQVMHHSHENHDLHDINENDDHTASSDELRQTPSSTPQPCSTGITTRLLPFKNDKGEIEWAFTDDLPPGSELDAFKVNPEPIKQERQDLVLLPVTSNDSEKRSVLANTPSSTASDDEKLSGKENDLELHQCPHCLTTFKMRGYLTRHLKKHASEKAYKCPFHKTTLFTDDNHVEHKCHPNGGFSRRDTYKTHLKLRHFRYPQGTSIRDRSNLPGHCLMCGEWFENGEIWCEIHVEGGECKYLPSGFRGKSRIKNRLKKQLAKMAKEQKQMLKKNGSLPAGQVPDTQAMATPTLSTPNSINTPLTSVAGSYDHHSPTYGTSVPPMPLVAEQHPPELQDYDDDFCLDVEQMGLSLLPPDPYLHSFPPYIPPY